MNRKLKSIISDELREDIIMYWKHQPVNTVPAMSKHFEVTEGVINSIINRYIRDTTKNMNNE